MSIETSLFEGLWAFWAAAGFIGGILLVGLAGRGPARLMMPVVRILSYPLRPFVFLLRRLGVLPKAATRARSVKNAVANARSATKQLRSKSETDIALALPDDDPLYDSDTEVECYDYRDAKAEIRKDGLFFRSIALRPGYLPAILTAPMSEDIGDKYLDEARSFFNRRPILNVNADALYEDAEGAVAITMFRKFDRRCYYILNEMRKTINGNARRLMMYFSIILIAAAFAVFAAPISGALKIGACAVAIGLMAIAHSSGYQKQQQHSIRELRSFLTRYLGRISDRFREVTGNARGVTVGDETDSQRLSESAIKWHKVMIWLPFRTFFIETFVRNLLYQIERNSQYYLYIWMPALGACAAIILGSWSLGRFTPPQIDEIVSWTCIAAFGLVVLFYLRWINKVVIQEELDQADWLGFDDLNVSAAMDEVVGKYAEDVGFWKGRFDR